MTPLRVVGDALGVVIEEFKNPGDNGPMWRDAVVASMPPKEGIEQLVAAEIASRKLSGATRHYIGVAPWVAGAVAAALVQRLTTLRVALLLFRDY